ncbi:MAG: site-specific integrase, partial [Acidobacteria bacterium]|nr:site-specific integrase [Acidobacteriota bacterium]
MSHALVPVDSTGGAVSPQQPRLLERLRLALEAKRFAAETVARFVEWNRRFIVHHGLRHPKTMGRDEIEAFLTAVGRLGYSAAVQGEARQALAFCYREILGQQIEWPEVARVARLRLPDGVTAQEAALLQSPKLLDRVRGLLRVRRYALSTEECYLEWMRRYIFFHHKRHPLELGAAHIEQFLTHLAVKEHVSASTQAQAFHAVLFLYRQVLQVELPLIKAQRAQRTRRLPVVLSRGEVRRVLEAIDGFDGLYRLMARLMYGTGMRLMECCRLRVKDVDWQRGQILVRQGKGDKDRVVMLPRALRRELEEQLQERRVLHDKDLARGIAHVPLPDALERK